MKTVVYVTEMFRDTIINYAV